MLDISDNVPESKKAEINVRNNYRFSQTDDDDDEAQNTCAICLEEFEIGAYYKKLPKCHHSFHAICIDQWLSSRAACPVCREEVFVTDEAL